MDLPRGIALQFIDNVDDQEYLVGPWVITDRPSDDAVVYWPTGADDPPMPLLELSGVLDGIDANWIIIAAPVGQRGPRSNAPEGASLQACPMGQSGPIGEGATVAFAGEFGGPHEIDYLVYAGQGAIPPWGDGMTPDVPDAGADPASAPPAARVNREVLTHVDAVVDAVRELRQSEACSPVELVFFDGIVEHLQVLREHVEHGRPANPSSVLRYLNFIREHLSEVMNLVPAAARLLEAVTEILRIAGA